jgi:type I restriction enzyme S subunit
MVSFVPMNDLGIREKSLTPSTERRLGDVSGSYTYFAEGDVLLAKITPCFENGKLGIASGLKNGIGFGSSEFIVLRPNDELDPEYLFYFLAQDSFRDAGARVMSGAVGHKRLPKEFIEKYPIPFPPLPEQKRIVAILDETFAGIEKAVANTEKNLLNANELYEAYLNNVFNQRSENWTLKKVDELSEVVSGYSFKSSDFINDKEIKTIKIANVGVKEFIPESNENLPNDFAKAYSKFRIPEGSIVIALTRSVIANGLKVAVVPEEFDGALLNQRVAAIKIESENLLRDYLFCFLCTQQVLDYVRRKANTLMQPNLSINDLKRLPVPLPPHDQMQMIVDNLQLLAAEVKSLKFIYQQKLTALAELKQSLLQKAFSGELTANANNKPKEAAA